MSKTYRIGIDARLYEETGVGRYIRNLIAHLAIIDNQNHYVLFLRKKTFQSIVLPGDNFSKVLADVRWHLPWEQIVMPYLFLNHKLDLLHYSYQNFAPTLLYPKKYILTVHDLTIAKINTGKIERYPYPLPQLKQLFFKIILRCGLQRACHVIAVSQAVRRDILETLPSISDCVSVIYEASELSPKTHNRSSQNNGNYFLYVGPAPPHKNLQFLMSAFSKTTLPGWRLILVGNDDFFYSRLRVLAEKKRWNSRILFKGNVSDDELSSLYRGAQALVFPSKAEGFGLPLTEAMAYGCLVLASDIPVLREICQDAAVYFDSSNQEELIALLHSVAQNPSLYQHYRDKGKHQADVFSWRKTAKETHACYESCLGIRSGE